MAHFAEKTRPPPIARKSSAQNLLSQFKASNASSNSSIPTTISLGGTTAVGGGSTMSFTSAGSSTVNGSTPTSATPTAREWDAQSLHSDNVGSSLGGAVSPQIGQGMSVEYLRELVQKRILTLTYIRNMHEGQGHWFHTIQISRNELAMAFNNSDMKKRTMRFAVLGLSLSSLLDINQPQDLLKGLLNTITEYDQSKEEGEKSKMRLFKRTNLRRGAAGIPEFSGSFQEGDTSYLFTPHIPFALDYHETLLSLIDVISEVYNKISKLLGPSPFHPSHHMMGPLGLLTPLPGVSYLFHGEHHLPNSNDQDVASSLWGIANASLNAPGIAGPSASMMFGNVLGSPPISNWTPNLGDMKVMSVLLKDLDELARNGIKDELASLEPLLRNRVPEGSGPSRTQQYEYDAM
ncbi:hypothetical protein D9611_004250 [Ephemerocybe angulata]|uniref:Uncharacterized protein n=1 Tax=Ephemerocybe angulata TaxID=980116 RepID=A0A8H5BKJ7_9AGAR|nr:hypothetical protein D9611_004250 [Tulosesus angulatus]